MQVLQEENILWLTEEKNHELLVWQLRGSVLTYLTFTSDW